MLARSGALSLVFSLLTSHVSALELDVNSQDSVKSVAKTLASGVVAFYDKTLEKDLTPGLFPDPYFWWESGVAWNALIDYYGLTNDSEYNSRISEALQHQLGDFDSFMPPNQTKNLGNQDQSFWGLASLSAHEAQIPAPASGSWFEFAVNVFNTQTARWDSKTCDGGLKWQIYSFNEGYNYKDSLSNGQLFLLAARLADLTGNITYTEWADKVYTWSSDVGLVTDKYYVYDGTDDTNNCTTINHLRWTAAHAIYTEGAAVMYNVSNAPKNWTDIVNGFVSASSVFYGTDGALVEAACENRGNCDIDQRAFKGIAVRSFGRAAQAAPSVAESINKMLSASAKGAAKNCEGSDEEVKCRLRWASWTNSTWEAASASDGNLGEVLNALQAVQALLWHTIDITAAGAGNDSSKPTSTNATASGSPSGSSGSASPTGAGATLATSFALVMAVAFAAALSC